MGDVIKGGRMINDILLSVAWEMLTLSGVKCVPTLVWLHSLCDVVNCTIHGG